MSASVYSNLGIRHMPMHHRQSGAIRYPVRPRTELHAARNGIPGGAFFKPRPRRWNASPAVWRHRRVRGKRAAAWSILRPCGSSQPLRWL